MSLCAEIYTTSKYNVTHILYYRKEEDYDFLFNKAMSNHKAISKGLKGLVDNFTLSVAGVDEEDYSDDKEKLLLLQINFKNIKRFEVSADQQTIHLYTEITHYILTKDKETYLNLVEKEKELKKEK